jgi:hypothetical protein
MTRIVAPKHYSRRTNRHVKAAKEWPNIKPIWMRCVKKPRACARCDWLATPQTRRGRCRPTKGGGVVSVPSRTRRKPQSRTTLLSITHFDQSCAVSCPLRDREMRGTLRSRQGPARRAWLPLGPSTGSILPLGRRAGSHRAAGTCSWVSDQQYSAADQALSGPRHGTTRIVLS